MIHANASLRGTWVVGDSLRDVRAATAAGITPFLLNSGDLHSVPKGTVIIPGFTSLARLMPFQGALELYARAGHTTILSCDAVNNSLLTVEAYNAITQSYVDKTERFAEEERRTIGAIIDTYKQEVQGEERPIVLDVGCGPARDMQFLIAKGYFYFGIDLSEQMILKAAADSKDRTTINWALAHVDMLELKLPAESVDFVIANSSIQHIERQYFRGWIEQTSRTLRNGGILYLHFRVGERSQLETSYEYDAGQYGVTRHFTYYAVEEVKSALSACGMNVVECDLYSTDYEKDDVVKKSQVPVKARVTALKE